VLAFQRIPLDAVHGIAERGLVDPGQLDHVGAVTVRVQGNLADVHLQVQLGHAAIQGSGIRGSTVDLEYGGETEHPRATDRHDPQPHQRGLQLDPIEPRAHLLAGPAACGTERTALRAAEGMTLEQRLIHMMIGNLRQTLYDYDRAQGSRLVEDDGRRVWLLQQVFRFFVRQMRYAVDWERPWPVHTWQDLHDLFVYLVVRGSVPLDSAFTVAVFDDEFDAAVEYKRLLLLGLVDGLTQRRAQTDAYFHLLKRWAADSSLVEPEKAMGRQDVIAVQVTQDAPPQLVRGKLTISFRGWVLRPAEGLPGIVVALTFLRILAGLAFLAVGGRRRLGSLAAECRQQQGRHKTCFTIRRRCLAVGILGRFRAPPLLHQSAQLQVAITLLGVDRNGAARAPTSPMR